MPGSDAKASPPPTTTTPERPDNPSALDIRREAMGPELWDTIGKMIEQIREHSRFRIVTHSRPDGDAIGSALGLYHFLEGMGKTAAVYTQGPLPRHFKFMDGFERIETEWMESWTPEITIYVDCGGLERAGNQDLRRGFTLSIDHHIGTENFGDLNYHDSAAAASGEQVFLLVKAAGEPITQEMAVCLYTAIISDTGNFRFSNAEAHVFDIATELIQAGAVPSEICSALFESRSPASVELMGRVLSSIHYECGGRLAWAEVLQSTYQELGGENAEPDGLVGDLRAIDGVQMAILMHETRDGRLRASLRSKDGVDARSVATRVGGGGHKHASGVLMDMAYAEAREKLLSEARASFAAYDESN